MMFLEAAAGVCAVWHRTTSPLPSPEMGHNPGRSDPQPSPGIRQNHQNLETGWGGRIRTYGARYQKPVPYHLATPQQCGAI